MSLHFSRNQFQLFNKDLLFLQRLFGTKTDRHGRRPTKARQPTSPQSPRSSETSLPGAPDSRLARVQLAAINALLELETESDSLLSRDPHLSTLSHHLATLKTLVASLRKSTHHHSLRSFLTRRASTQSLSRLAGSIESEIQAWIDRESLDTLTKALKQQDNEEELFKLLSQFEDRVLRGFDRELQDLVLKTRVFNLIESCLCDSNSSNRVREHCAFVIVGLIKFNKDVFVGQVLMGATIKALLTMASPNSIRVLCSLVRIIKSPLVDEIEFNRQIPKIISLLNWDDSEMRVMGFGCVLEIGYFGRKDIRADID
ncbi:hypothetical protein ACLB2K_000227 [Fragaria x ananassa]